MSLRLVFICLFVGTVSGLLTVFIIPAEFEILIWITIIVLIALYSVKSFGTQLFKKTFFNASLTGVVITSIHLIFLNDYLVSHLDEQELLDSFGIHSDRIGLLMIAPIYWILLGLLTGSLALLLQRFGKRKTNAKNS